MNELFMHPDDIVPLLTEEEAREWREKIRFVNTHELWEYRGTFAALFQLNCKVKELSTISRSTKVGWWSPQLKGVVRSSLVGAFIFETKAHGTFSVPAEHVRKIIDEHGGTVCELREIYDSS